MNRIDKLFRRLKKQRKKAFIVYVTAGYPSMPATEKLLPVLEKSGADLVELGIPFSDPLADGPTIQRSSHEALLKGATVSAILKMVRRAREKVTLPLVFMTYYNPILKYGLKKFIIDSKKAGVDGVIVPDLPPDEAGPFISFAKGMSFDTIFLAAPTSTRKRLEKIAKKSTGFIYYVSLTGVTGARKRLPKDIVSHVRELKKITQKPVCVGFGISTPIQARRISRLADGIIVGSALIKVVEKSGRGDIYKKAKAYVRRMAKAVRGKKGR